MDATFLTPYGKRTSRGSSPPMPGSSKIVVCNGEPVLSGTTVLKLLEEKDRASARAVGRVEQVP